MGEDGEDAFAPVGRCKLIGFKYLCALKKIRTFMKWKNFLYFSTGERRVLALLLLLTSVSAVLISQINKKVKSATPQMIVRPENAPRPMLVDTTVPPPREPDVVAAERPAPKSEAGYERRRKYPAGTKVELNTADTASLKMVPQIGSFYAKKIVELRDNLGGFYSVEQLREVYRMDEDRFAALRDWFYADTSFIAPLFINYLPMDSMAKHPYISSAQALAICSLRRGEPLEGWDKLCKAGAFTDSERERLKAYCSFFFKK